MIYFRCGQEISMVLLVPSGDASLFPSKPICLPKMLSFGDTWLWFSVLLAYRRCVSMLYTSFGIIVDTLRGSEQTSVDVRATSPK